MIDLESVDAERGLADSAPALLGFLHRGDFIESQAVFAPDMAGSVFGPFHLFVGLTVCPSPGQNTVPVGPFVSQSSRYGLFAVGLVVSLSLGLDLVLVGLIVGSRVSLPFRASMLAW